MMPQTAALPIIGDGVSPRLAGGDLQALLRRQRAAFLAAPYPSAGERIDRLNRGIGMVTRNKARLIAAIDADFGGRAAAISLIADILTPLSAFKHARGRVRRWMRPERRAAQFPLGLLGLRAWVEFQPLGVIGVLAPWNSPAALSLVPLASILAAGNRVMIKPSELTPSVAALLAEIIGQTYGPDEVAVVQGGVDVAQAFSRLGFDHLLYTGGGQIARHVMRAAADNLTPVTLELGGKSPAIVADDADIADAAAKIMGGKLSNAGQICMCPDHAWVPHDKLGAFTDAAAAAARRMFPTIAGNADVTAVVGAAARARLAADIREAAAAGATVIELGEADPARPGVMVPTLVVDAPEQCRLNQTEVFGPVLPIRSYRSLPALIDRLNGGPVPLAVYFFGHRAADIAMMRTRARAGGMTLNDVMLHPFMQDLPFGGLGESGMGRYVGQDGFRSFSHHKATARRGWLDIGRYIQPPYSPRMLRLLDLATR